VVNFLGGAEASTYPALVVYDISGPVPVVIGAVIDAVNGYKSYAIAVEGNRAYVVNFLGGAEASTYPALVVYDISTDIPVVIGAAAIDAVNGYQSNSVAVEGDRVYVLNRLIFDSEVSTHPALVTYDVSGSVPVVIGASVPDGTRTYGFNARSVAVRQNRAYVVNFLTDNYDTPAGPSVDVYPPLVVYDISGSTPVVIGVAAIDPATIYAAWAVAVNGTIAYVATFLWNPNAGLLAYVRPRLSSTIVPSSGGAVSRCQVSHVLPSRLLARDWSAFQRQIEVLRPADVEEVRGSRFDFC
jgi:hypothetical protein